MAGTRKQIDSSVPPARRRSLLRDSVRPMDDGAADKRPAGPSSFSDPGMGSPTSPLPPGVSNRRLGAFLTHPQIAGSFRNESGSTVEANPDITEEGMDPDER